MGNRHGNFKRHAPANPDRKISAAAAQKATGQRSELGEQIAKES